MSTTSKSNGTGQPGVAADAPSARDELGAVLAELKADLTSLRADLNGLKTDGVALGRTATDVAGAKARHLQAKAETKVEDVRDTIHRSVRTVEDDLQAVASDIGTQMRRNPYATVGLAVFGGMLLSRALRKD